ncbi:MFS transporter [Hyalangium gracile]|uniref:MFS transporter n=1 Tax=Hyalangium gracile TaxID=394092 RepID=UPI001CCA0904|nr:MFS transporter [Hyalangium gracile]
MHDAPTSSPVPRPEHSRAFRFRRAQNWLTLGFTYAAMYMGRYNFSFANAKLSETYGWTKTEVGAIISAATLIYGLSALFNGPIADRIGGRKAMLVGAVGSVVFNFAFGLGAYLGMVGTGTVLLGYLATVWSLNMYFQSYSALALIKVNSGWFHVGERGVFSAIFGSMIQSGRALIYAIGPLVVLALPWQWVFFVPALIIAGMGLLTWLVVRDGPDEAGLPALDTGDASSGYTGKVDLKYVAKVVFTNPVTLTIAVAEFCTGFVRHGFEQWFPRYMQEAQKLSLDSAVFKKGAMAVVIAGILGAFAAGLLSDLLFKSRRPPVAFLGYLIQVACLGVVWMAPSLNAVVIAFVLNSFAISIVHSMLSGTASMDFGGKKAAATAAGMFDGMQYVGGAAVGAGMGSLLDRFGWGVWGPSMIGFSAIGAVLMLVLWNARPKAHVGPSRDKAGGPPAQPPTEVGAPRTGTHG